jgi:hypothetical protein
VLCGLDVIHRGEREPGALVEPEEGLGEVPVGGAHDEEAAGLEEAAGGVEEGARVGDVLDELVHEDDVGVVRGGEVEEVLAADLDVVEDGGGLGAVRVDVVAEDLPAAVAGGGELCADAGADLDEEARGAACARGRGRGSRPRGDRR